MPETLSSKQSRFTLNIAKLLLWMSECGYQPKLGEGKRSDEQAEINAIGVEGRSRVAALIKLEFPLLAQKIVNNGKNNGIRNTVHEKQLGQDIDLLKNGAYLSTTEDHRRFGEWWENQGPDHRWGGRWGDGNHYSFEHEGVK